jgi:hypothetical protein
VALDVAFGTQIQAAAQRWGLDPKLLAAVAAQETGGPGSNSGRNVVGDGGHGHGLFQIDDRSHAFAQSPAAMDPAQNADYAAQLLHGNLVQNNGKVRAALSEYNAGSPTATGTVTTWADGQSLGYADSVERHYALLGGSQATAAVQPASTGDDPSQDALAAYASSLSSSSFSIPPPANDPNVTMSGALQAMGQTDSESASMVDAMFDDGDDS